MLYCGEVEVTTGICSKTNGKNAVRLTGGRVETGIVPCCWHAYDVLGVLFSIFFDFVEKRSLE